MNAEGVNGSVRWTLDQLKTRRPSMVAEAGYDDITKMIDQKAIAQSLSQVEKDIFANVIVKIVMSAPEADLASPSNAGHPIRSVVRRMYTDWRPGITSVYKRLARAALK
jgi:hypothetical protein